jgi:outer membrane protein assembly factor BamA
LRFNTTYSKDDSTVFTKGAKTSGFNTEEVSFSFILERQFTRRIRYQHNLYTLSLPRLFDIVEEPDRSRAKYRIGSIGGTLTLDSRDSYFNPTRGVLSLSTAEYAAPRFGGDPDADFLLLRQSLTLYHGWLKTHMLLAQLSVSQLWGLGVSQGIPQNRRLTLGGPLSLRSLSPGQLRVDQDGVLNQRTIEAKLEYRQPFLENFGFAYFYDVGQLATKNFSDSGLRQAVGVGLRYTTPVGPLSVDFAVNVNRQNNEDPFRVSFAIGNF